MYMFVMGGTKITSRTTQRTRYTEVTGSAFLLEPLSQVPMTLLPVCHGRVQTRLPLPPECPGYKPAIMTVLYVLIFLF